MEISGWPSWDHFQKKNYLKISSFKIQILRKWSFEIKNLFYTKYKIIAFRGMEVLSVDFLCQRRLRSFSTGLESHDRLDSSA